MKRTTNAILLKAARYLDADADLVRDSFSVPQSNPPVWEDVKYAREYRDLQRTADKLRGLTMVDEP